jgi:hypothetical protein
MSARAEGTDNERRMLAATPWSPARGRGPATDGEDFSRHEYDHPAAGWGAARSVGRVLERSGEEVEGVRALLTMNQEDGGFDCPGCAWPDDPSGLRLDICENGAKAQVGLPHSEFLDQGNIGTVCTRPQLAAHACPAGSVSFPPVAERNHRPW